jgi:hypothetical protein
MDLATAAGGEEEVGMPENMCNTVDQQDAL